MQAAQLLQTNSTQKLPQSYHTIQDVSSTTGTIISHKNDIIEIKTKFQKSENIEQFSIGFGNESVAVSWRMESAEQSKIVSIPLKHISGAELKSIAFNSNVLSISLKKNQGLKVVK